MSTGIKKNEKKAVSRGVKIPFLDICWRVGSARFSHGQIDALGAAAEPIRFPARSGVHRQH
ncbi:MAG: hypothetical protein CMQ40_12705 [Gammaproteobacteria bacterium]|nr:hypothetical protein [Gammaproteobacteria bacterium]